MIPSRVAPQEIFTSCPSRTAETGCFFRVSNESGKFIIGIRAGERQKCQACLSIFGTKLLRLPRGRLI